MTRDPLGLQLGSVHPLVPEGTRHETTVVAMGLNASPGESMREVAVRYAREQAALEHLRPVDDPHVERIDDGPPYGRGWLVSWERMQNDRNRPDL